MNDLPIEKPLLSHSEWIDTVSALSPASFWTPDYISYSAWLEHAPFAFWLCAALQPRRFVELGTHHGFSYFAFCQAIARTASGTAAYAIDTWTGDTHTGFYDDSVYQSVSEINIQRYAGFSKLIRSTFVQSARYFEDKSIDLLHVDGRHFYDDVKEDFETWLPKMTDEGVVLFHDINVRERDFGVWRFFDELARDRPAFRFLHGHGLGVVALGAQAPAPLRPLFEASRPVANTIRSVYAALGGALLFRRGLIAKSDGLTMILKNDGDASGIDPEQVALASDMDPQLDLLFQMLRRRAEQAAEQAAARDAVVRTEIGQLHQRLAGAQAETEQVHRRLAEARGEVKKLQQQVDQARSLAAGSDLGLTQARSAASGRFQRLERQAQQLERDAVAERTRVNELAATAESLLAPEHAAEVTLAEAQQNLESLLQRQRDGLKTLSGRLKFKLRRSGHPASARNMMLVVDQAAQNVRSKYDLYQEARALRRKAERAALAAEPRASELESAAAVMRAEANTAGDLMRMDAAANGSTIVATAGTSYQRWVELCDTITDKDRRAIQARLSRFAYKPVISVVMPVYNTPPALLRAAVESVRTQLYPHWELCVADDASTDPEVLEFLREAADEDPRIKVSEREINGHISAASNSALTLATGEFVALMDHDDILPEHALFEVVFELNMDRDLDILYSDEDHIDGEGRRSNPYFKTDFNPEIMLAHNMINHLGVYRRTMIEGIGGFKVGYEGSQDYDLALRAIDASTPERIRHIPAVLYHWRQGSGEASYSEAFMQKCIASAQRALGDHLERKGENAKVQPHPDLPLWQRVRRAVPVPAPLVSVIVPTRDKADVLKACIDGVLNRTDYAAVELIVVDHQSVEPETAALFADLKRDERVRVIGYEGPFNYSAINNRAVKEARGDILALLNNDVEVINADWLSEMVGLAVLPGVGAVGAKLLYPDGRIQHGGVILGPGGVAGHLFHLLDRNAPGYMGRALLTSTVSAITAACLVVRRSVFEEVGGFDADNLAVAFNDVDLCLKIGANGHRNVWTPHAQLYHHESLSRGSDDAPERAERFRNEIDFMIEKWGDVLKMDPFYNPNLDVVAADFNLAFPSRREKPWKAHR